MGIRASQKEKRRNQILIFQNNREGIKLWIK